MATLTIRKLDDEVYERLRAQAQRNARSIEAEASEVLAQRIGAEAAPDRSKIDDLVERLRANLARQKPDPNYAGSVATIRAIRDEE